MIDLAVGTRFYYNGKLCKVVETEYDYRCSECDLSINECCNMSCGSGAREDGKNICFKWVKDTEDTEDMGEGKKVVINPRAICNHCYYAHSCDEVLRGLEMLECSMYRYTHNKQDLRRMVWKVQ